MPLDFNLLNKIRSKIDIPLVLHGASSIEAEDLKKAVKKGIRKVNVGSSLKQAFFKGIKDYINLRKYKGKNPYEIIGSGFSSDILMQGRVAMQKEVEKYISILGSRDKAD